MDDFSDCDGKKCGQGKWTGGKAYVCPHYNLKVKNPELIPEWHPDNGPMENYTPGSHAKVLWKCQKDTCGCHIWPAQIYSRTVGNKQNGCPFCSPGGKSAPCHDNLKTNFPNLISEWHPDNEPMETYRCHSNKKVLWKCSKNNNCSCHVWEAVIKSRTGPDKVGCPFCNGKQVCQHDNLETNYPELKKEWAPFNVKQMNEYAPQSHSKVWWICSNEDNCGCHVWECPVYSRTGSGRHGCPFCNHINTCKCVSLEALCPSLKKEWDPINGPMNEYAVNSNKRVSWICSINADHKWEAIISNRTGEDETGCPHCSKSKGYSYAEIRWIKEIEEKEGIKIRHALSDEGQYLIPGLSKVDGYCEETNTVYEFLGDYWHGNPLVFPKDGYNKRNGKTYGELYEKTITKCRIIQEMGYNLVVKWETESIQRGRLTICAKSLIIKK